MRNTEQEAALEGIPPWAEPLGAIVVLLLLAGITLIAAGGWKWSADFLTSSASGWVQAFGSIAAIWGAFSVANRQHKVQVAKEREAARQDRRRRLEICRTVLTRAGAVFDSAARSLEIPYSAALLRREVAHAEGLLQALPLFDVPDATLVHRLGLLGQSLSHLSLGLDQMDDLGDLSTRKSYVRNAKAQSKECSVTLLYCGGLLRACSTEDELAWRDIEPQTMATLAAYVENMEQRAAP